MTERHPPGGLGPSLRRAWVGYQVRLDQAMAEAGFADRRFPDGRVLRLCQDGRDISISEIGRRLGMSRQGAAKIVAGLLQRGYVTVTPSPEDGREKLVLLTPRATEYLQARRAAARRLERHLRDEIGPDSFDVLRQLLDLLAVPEPPRLRDYLADRNA